MTVTTKWQRHEATEEILKKKKIGLILFLKWFVSI